MAFHSPLAPGRDVTDDAELRFFIREIREIRGQPHSMKHEQLTRDIIGAAMAVLNALKPGLDEKLYETP